MQIFIVFALLDTKARYMGAYIKHKHYRLYCTPPQDSYVEVLTHIVTMFGDNAKQKEIIRVR